MAGAYTRKRLTKVEDSTEESGFGEFQEALSANRDLEVEQTGVSFHRVKPGKRQAFGHRHARAEEVYVVVSGSGRVKLDDEIVELERLDAIRVSPAVVRACEGGPEGIEFIAFGARREGDAEVVHGWWSE